MNTLDIRIRRVVWHGAGRPEAAVLAEAIEEALSLRLAGDAQARGPSATLGACGEAVAREIAARVPCKAEDGDG